MIDAKEKINTLFKEYEDNDSVTETNEEKVKQLLNTVHSVLMVKYPKPENISTEEYEKKINFLMHKFMANMYSNEPALVHSEKILNAIGNKDLESAIKYYEKLQTLRKSEISNKQSSIAKKSRSDPLTSLISNILKTHPNINFLEIIDMLGSGNYSETIIEICDGKITYLDINNNMKDTNINNLRSRISRLKKSKEEKIN